MSAPQERRPGWHRLEIDRAVLWRAALLQAALVVALALALAAVLPESFFEDWGWLSGPLAWLACAALTARILALPVAEAVLGALIAGLPSAIAVMAGIHWLGVALAVALFALACAHLAMRPSAMVPR